MRHVAVWTLCLLAFWCVPAWSYTWALTTIDSTYQSGFHAQVRVDNLGRPHIGYLSRLNANSGIRHAYRTGGQWTIETVDPKATVGCGLSMAIGHDNLPRFAYYFYPDSTGTHGMGYTSYRNGAWAADLIDPLASSDSSSNCLVLDSQDSPRLVYPRNTTLQYVTKSGDNWQFNSVLTPSTPSYPSIALDANGRPFVTYSTRMINLVVCARLEGAAWILDTVATTIGWYTAVAVDSSGKPRMIYCDNSLRTMMYAYSDGTQWHTESVGPCDVSAYSCLVLDSLGNPHIAYRDSSSRLIYARRIRGQWQFDTVASSCSGYVSLALSGNTAHLAYYTSAATLNYATAGVPEPASAVVLGNILLGAAALMRRRRGVSMPAS